MKLLLIGLTLIMFAANILTDAAISWWIVFAPAAVVAAVPVAVILSLLLLGILSLLLGLVGLVWGLVRGKDYRADRARRRARAKALRDLSESLAGLSKTMASTRRRIK